MLLELVGNAFPLLGVGRRSLLGRDIGPRLGVFGVDAQPFLDALLGIRLDRLDRAFRLADPAIDAFVRMDDQHVVTLVEAVHRTDFDAIGVFAFDAGFSDDVSHPKLRNGSIFKWLRSAGTPLPQGKRTAA